MADFKVGDFVTILPLSIGFYPEVRTGNDGKVEVEIKMEKFSSNTSGVVVYYEIRKFLAIPGVAVKIPSLNNLEVLIAEKYLIHGHFATTV
jgi:hypothetical protein